MFLLYLQLGILVVLAIANIWMGQMWGMYESIWWWDWFTHFLGGVWAGVFVWWLTRSYIDRPILVCAVGAFAIGIVWEIFEYYVGVGGSSFMSYGADTLKDQIVDTLGGAVGGLAIHLERTLWQRK